MSRLLSLFSLARPLLAGTCGLLSPLVAPSAMAQAAAVGQSAPAAVPWGSVSTTAQFTVKGVRPEAFSWLWDNADQPLLSAANPDVQAFAWVQPPATPQHLGYSAGAHARSTAVLAGAARRVDVVYLPPDAMRGLVASDNELGNKPYSFVAQSVSIDGRTPFTVLVQYIPVGTQFGDSQFLVQAMGAAEPVLAQAYVDHLRKTLLGLQPTLMNALSERYFNAVFKKRGYYQIGAVDKKLNVTLTVVQEIRGIDSLMLSWWWDHIGNTARYRLWQPVDHVSFEWAIPPVSPDLQYDIGAVQKVKEYIGKTAMTLNITGADPRVKTPPVPLADPAYFYATANLPLLSGVLPDNTLVHQWRPNDTGDGVVLRSTFVNTALARVLNKTFFEDLGSHALREFQMLPYFLPRLYKREYLQQ